MHQHTNTLSLSYVLQCRKAADIDIKQLMQDVSTQFGIESAQLNEKLTGMGILGHAITTGKPLKEGTWLR